MEKRGEKGVLAIVDADTDHLNGVVHANPNLLITHTRDVESLMLQSDALRDVLIEFDVDEVFGDQPELAAVTAAASIAAVKFIADREKSRVRSTELNFAKFINPLDLTCDSKKLCNEMETLTSGVGVTADIYERELAKILALNKDPFQIARGHDVTSLLAWAIVERKGVKRKAGALIDGDLIESYLRAAYPDHAFGKCELFKRLEHWETKNSPFRVLRR